MRFSLQEILIGQICQEQLNKKLQRARGWTCDLWDALSLGAQSMNSSLGKIIEVVWGGVCGDDWSAACTLRVIHFSPNFTECLAIRDYGKKEHAIASGQLQPSVQILFTYVDNIYVCKYIFSATRHIGAHTRAHTPHTPLVHPKACTHLYGLHEILCTATPKQTLA